MAIDLEPLKTSSKCILSFRVISNPNYTIYLRNIRVYSSNSVPETVFANSFRIFPNPSSSAVNIAFEQDLTADVIVRIYDLTGSLRISRQFTDLHGGRNNLNLSLDDLRAGMYFVSVEYQGLTSVQKIVKY